MATKANAADATPKGTAPKVGAGYTMPAIGTPVQYIGTDGATRPATVLEHLGGTQLKLSVNMGGALQMAEALHADDKARDKKEHSSWQAL